MGNLGDNFYPGITDEKGKPIPLSGEDAIQRVREETDTIMVGFSGKDALGAYLAVKDVFPNVICYHRMFVPGLQFVERRLRYWEELFGIHILRVPNPMFYRMIKNCLWQPPHRVPYIQTMNIPDVEWQDINKMVMDTYNLPPETFVAVGVRAADSLQRRTTCKSRGPINWSERMFWPVWDWSHQRLANVLKQRKIKLPTEYSYWGTSFDGLRWFFTKEIRERYPEDWQTILDWYPMADMEFYRRNLGHQPWGEQPTHED